MATDFKAFGDPWTEGRFTVQEERRGPAGKPRFRLTSVDPVTNMVVTIDDLIDMANLFDDVCEEITEIDEAADG